MRTLYVVSLYATSLSRKTRVKPMRLSIPLPTSYVSKPGNHTSVRRAAFEGDVMSEILSLSLILNQTRRRTASLVYPRALSRAQVRTPRVLVRLPWRLQLPKSSARRPYLRTELQMQTQYTLPIHCRVLEARLDIQICTSLV